MATNRVQYLNFFTKPYFTRISGVFAIKDPNPFSIYLYTFLFVSNLPYLWMYLVSSLGQGLATFRPVRSGCHMGAIEHSLANKKKSTLYKEIHIYDTGYIWLYIL